MWAPPADSAPIPSRPSTATGTVLDWAEPLPRRPLAPAPQQRAVPSARSAQECPSPAVTATASESPTTSTGVELERGRPEPSWPEPPSPQQRTVPSARAAQAWPPPTATSTASARSSTPTGVKRSAAPPSPTWPEEPSPQQRTVPSQRTAQDVSAPAATVRTALDSTACADAVKVNVSDVKPSGLPEAHAPATSKQGSHQAIVASGPGRTTSRAISRPPTPRVSQAPTLPRESTARTRGRTVASRPYAWRAVTPLRDGASGTSAVSSTLPSPSKSHSTRSTSGSAPTSALNVNSVQGSPSGAPGRHWAPSRVWHGDHQPICAVGRNSSVSRPTSTPPSSRRSQAPTLPSVSTPRTCG